MQGLSDTLDQDGDALTDTDAHRRHRALKVAVGQLDGSRENEAGIKHTQLGVVHLAFG